MSCPEIAYPEIEFKWFERGGLQFQVQFINKEYTVKVALSSLGGMCYTDNIAAGISPFNPDKVALAAGRIML